MWRIKRRRTKPKTEGNKVIYPKLNSTAKPNRYQSRNTYLDVKCNKELGAGCTDVGCQNTIDACGNFYSCKTAPYRNPILGYRKHLVCCYNKSLWPTSFDLYISNTLYASGNIGRWTIVPELWVRPSIASLPNTPYNPVYKGPNDSSGNPIYMTFGYVGSGVGPYPASPRQWNIFNSINGKTGLEWLIIFDTAQAYNPSSSYRFTNIGNALSSNFTTVESLNLPSYPSTQDKENNLIKNIFTVTINNSGGTNTISNLSFEIKTSKDVSGNVYKDNYAKTCATHPEACYNQVIRTKQNKNGCVDESYNYTTNQYLNRRCLKFQQQEFNFLSQVPVDNIGCGTKFAVCPNCQLSTETAATSIIVAPTNNSANTLIYTRDGNTWIGLGNDIFSAPSSLSSPPSIFVKNNGKIWVAGGKDNTGAGGTSFGLAYSIDGINWTGTQTPPATDVSNISVQNAAYSNNLWMAIADYGSNPLLNPSGRYKILSSSNGIDWVIKFNIPIPSFQPSSIEYGNGTWIIFGKKTTGSTPDLSNVYVSVDEGNSWSFKSTPLNLCSKGFYGDNLWVAVGATSPVGGSAIITSNDNGSTWTQITSFYGNFKGVGSDIFYNGNLWVVVGSQGPGNVSMAYSNDGLVWNSITNPIHNMYSVAWKPGGPWVASSDTAGVSPYYYSEDGITWTASSTNIVNAPQQDSYLGGGISTPFIPANKCICNKNGFCVGINKLPCETKNTKCYAIYKRSNPKFKKQGAVSGGSRINRLKYQTRMKAQGRTVNGRKNVINGRRPATLYRTSKPLTLRDNTCVNPPPPPSDLSYETLSGSIIVTWRAGDISKLCRIAPLTGFTIQRTGSPFGHTEPVFGNTYTYSNLPIGSYDIRVRADSYYGSSDWTYLYQIPVGNVPSAPVIIDGYVIPSNEQVSFKFIPPVNIPGFPIQSYQYYLSPSGTWTTISPPSNNTIIITGLNNGTTYTIKIRAINSLGTSDDSNSITATPGAIPEQIVDLAASNISFNSVTLTWSPPISTTPIIRYDILGGLNSNWVSLANLTTTMNINGLDCSSNYSFNIRAVTNFGPAINPGSNTVSIQTLGKPIEIGRIDTNNIITPDVIGNYVVSASGNFPVICLKQLGVLSDYFVFASFRTDDNKLKIAKSDYPLGSNWNGTISSVLYPNGSSPNQEDIGGDHPQPIAIDGSGNDVYLVYGKSVDGPGLYLRKYDESVTSMSDRVTLFSTVQPGYTGAGYISMDVNQGLTTVDSIYVSYVNFPSPKIYFGRKDIPPWTDDFSGNGQILISGDGSNPNTPGFANSISAPINSGSTTNVFIAWIEGTTSSGAPYKVQFRKSTNNGDSWGSSSSIIPIDNQNITSKKSVNIIAVTNTSLIVSYIKSSKVYVKTSNNGGNTWSSGIVASGNATVSEMSVMKRNGDNIFISYYFGPPDNSLGIAWSSLDSENNLTEWCQKTTTTLVQNAKETGLVVDDSQNLQALIIGAGDGNGVRLGGINADP